MIHLDMESKTLRKVKYGNHPKMTLVIEKQIKLSKFSILNIFLLQVFKILKFKNNTNTSFRCNKKPSFSNKTNLKSHFNLN